MYLQIENQPHLEKCILIDSTQSYSINQLTKEMNRSTNQRQDLNLVIQVDHAKSDLKTDTLKKYTQS